MNFREYVPLAMRTNKPKETKVENLLNACLGLVGEYSEFLTALNREERKDELSDMFWYTALLHHTLETNYTSSKAMGTPMSYIGLICDTVKKHAFQGHVLATANLTAYAENLLHSICVLCERNNFNPSEIMEFNIAKLRKRYPDGFAVEKSVNREEYTNARG